VPITEKLLANRSVVMNIGFVIMLLGLTFHLWELEFRRKISSERLSKGPITERLSRTSELCPEAKSTPVPLD
jgi:hypothetical protein